MGMSTGQKFLSRHKLSENLVEDWCIQNLVEDWCIHKIATMIIKERWEKALAKYGVKPLETGSDKTCEMMDEGVEVNYEDAKLLMASSRPRRKNRAVGICVLMFALIAAIVFVSLAVTGSFNGADQIATQGATQDPPPSNPIPTVAPTTSPVPPPIATGSPQTEDPSSAPSRSPMFDLIYPIAGDAILDEASPQHAAYQWLAYADELGSTSLEKLTQRFSAATIFFSLTGAQSGSAGANEVLRADECLWTFFSCSGSGSIDKLSMAGLGFGGSLPPEIGNLLSLERIDLGGNSLVGTVPDELFTLSGLKFLYLEGNSLSGTISDYIGTLTNLESIYLGNNLFNGTIPSALASAGSLSESAPILQSQALWQSVSYQFFHLRIHKLAFQQVPGTHTSSLESSKLALLGLVLQPSHGCTALRLGH